MEGLWNPWDMQTVFLALAVLLLATTGMIRRGLYWLLTQWLGLTHSNASRLAKAAIGAAWLVILILLTVYRAGS